MEESIQPKQTDKSSNKSAETKNKKQPTSKEKDTKQSALKKIDPECAKLLSAIKDKANKKEFGRKIRDTEIIQLALGLIENKHIEALQEATYSEQDRLKFAHMEFQKSYGKISLDQFIGKLLRGEVPGTPKELTTSQ